MYALCLEATHARGLGHLFRMLNLAHALRAREEDFVFVLNDYAPARSVLARAGMPFRIAPVRQLDADWETPLIAETGTAVWIDDRLDTDARHASRVKSAGVRRVTFDDRGSGARLADLHVAALAFLQGAPLEGARVLTGIDYLILNPDIVPLRRLRRQARRWIVTLGGTDTWGATVSAVKVLAETDREVTVVLGPGFRHEAELEAVIPSRFQVKRNLPSLIEELSRHDVAVTGGGITAFEACASGLPTVVIASENFEIPVGRHLAALGCARFAGHHAAFDRTALSASIAAEAMSAAGLARVPADGLERVCREVTGLA